jgi:hypothetical protein
MSPVISADDRSGVSDIRPLHPAAPAAQPARKRRRRLRMVVVVTMLVVVAGFVPLPAWASMFGEENTTLVQLLVQSLRMNQQMAELSSTASKMADYAQDLVSTYKRVNAGIEAIRNYDFESFTSDVRSDLYNQYPGFAKLEMASQSLAHWDDTRAGSPWSAYQAITAAVGDASRALRDDVATGRTRIDQELILAGEASGGFAAAHTAEQVTEKFDRDVAALNRLAKSASPAQAEQISARASLMLAAQNSYMMRLLARAVRLDAVGASIDYATRMSARNSSYAVRDETESFLKEANRPPTLVDFSDGVDP